VEPELVGGSLIRVLEDWRQPFPGFFLYHPGRRQRRLDRRYISAGA
jgi:hypothetical protein